MIVCVKPVVEPTLVAQPSATPSVYDERGVDRSLIRSALQRTPTECLELLEDLLALAESACRVDEPVR
jgi:hypothetical protein